MRRVHPETLWLGNVGDVRALDTVLDAGISALVDLALEERVRTLPRELVYCRFPILDGSGNSASVLRLAMDMTSSLLRAEVPTLVFCSGGVSRTPAIAAAALALLRQSDPDECLKNILQQGIADVSTAFWADVKSVFRATSGEGRQGLQSA